MFPDLITEMEMHTLENLRGIPKELNAELHLSALHSKWNRFLRENLKPTREQINKVRDEVDEESGHLFLPSWGKKR